MRGQVVWVTGASSGIGEHLAVDLARHGAKLVLSARREDQLDRVKDKCLEGSPVLRSEDVLVLPLDVTKFDTHQAAFDKVINHFGCLDVLVSNAGRSQRCAWEEAELEVDRRVLELNVLAVVSLTRVALRYFLRRGGGHVAVTSSLAGVEGVPFSCSYTGSKHALHGYFNSLRNEKMGSNLTVTILCPGPVFTNFLSESFTGKVDQKFGESARPTDKRMSAERCAHLCAVALANKLDEVWMAPRPILPLIYLFRYYPTIGRALFKFLGPKYLLKLRDSRQTVEAE
ncbi:dehydrogenase/reductase SDR family member 7 isoform X2 [Bacillus rossius redtenbacheri]